MSGLVEIKVETGRFTPENLRRVAELVPDALLRAMKTSIAFAVGHTVKTKMESANPPFLNRRTGNLIRSVTESQKAQTYGKDGAVGSFGTKVKYGVMHEVGFVGKILVPAHSRRATEKRRAHEVREHYRNVNLRARWYLRTGLDEQTSEIQRRADRAIEVLVRTGVLPDPKELI